MAGLKHLIECHCTLKIFEKSENLQYHKFPVYSKIIDNKVVPKIVKCNNCEALHYVYDVCKSELKASKDQTQVALTIEDISLSIPEKLCNVLYKYSCDISVWEHCLDILEEERWWEFVVIKRDIIDENENVKMLIINSEKHYKVQNKVINTTLIV